MGNDKEIQDYIQRCEKLYAGTQNYNTRLTGLKDVFIQACYKCGSDVYIAINHIEFKVLSDNYNYLEIKDLDKYNSLKKYEQELVLKGLGWVTLHLSSILQYYNNFKYKGDK